MKRSRWIVVAVVGMFVHLCLANLAVAQENVRFVVSVTSAGNTPVMDLAKSDFTLMESGKPQTISPFITPHAKTAPAKLAPNEYSNIPDFRESSGAIFVVFDTIHTRYLDERDERALVLKFLGKAAEAKHAVTLAIVSEKGLTIYHDYRTGSDVLLAALAKAGLGGMKGATPPPGVDDAQVAADAARLTAFSKGDQSNAAPQNQLLRSNIDMILTMFEDVGFSAEGLPGRKSLVWITNAVPFDIDPKTMQFKSPQTSSQGAPVNGAAVGGSRDQLNAGEIKRLSPVWRESMRALFDGGVAVYPVEVRGSASTAANSLSQIAMKTLADLTGGKAFFGSNDPFPELLAVGNGNTAGYELGFTPPAATGTDFRRVQVSVARANVEVAQPAGYFAYEAASKARAGQELGVALSSPLEYTGVRFKVGVAGMEDAPGGKKKVNFVVTLPGDSGVLNETAGTVDIGFVAKATNAAGQVVGSMNEGAGNKFPPEAVAQIKELGFQLKRSFEISTGDCTVHFLLRDNQTGRMGDVIFPLSVK